VTGAPAAVDVAIAVPDAGTVSGLLLMPSDAWALLVFGHGAGAGMRHAFMERMAARLVARGVGTLRYNFPYTEAKRGRPDRPAVLTAAVRAAAAAAAEHAQGRLLLAGGKSMGGRMTSLAASELPLAGVRGLVFFGFPLHPAGAPGVARAEHLGAVGLPMLFLQGTRDDLADLTLLRPICAALGPGVILREIDGADHGFHVLKRSGRTDDAVLDALAQEVASWAQGLHA
jgi:predicted alpha/beta-hydrolase family hydrolase